MRNEQIRLGASFVEVLCNTCRSVTGAKILYTQHKGYESKGAEPVTPEELLKGERVAREHEKITGHETRLIEGQLEGRIY